MKKFLYLAILLSGLFASYANAALKSDFYRARSVLADGKWVKIGIDKTGVYEISYSELRDMGFSEPSKVSVYGRGGRVLPEDFTTNSGSPTLTDDLNPVKVLHENDKIYFYGLGPEEIQFISNNSYAPGGYFQRKSRNIYSTRGYYFLTDSKPVEPIEVKSNGNATITVNRGMSFVYHELDSMHNRDNTGQLFWGEHVGEPKLKRRTWKVEMPDAISGKGVMECVLYITRMDQDWIGELPATVSYGFEESDDIMSMEFKETSQTYIRPHEPTIYEVGIPGNNGTVFAEFDYKEVANFSNVDYWVVSYDRYIPTMKGIRGESLNQQLFALPAITNNSIGKFTLGNCASLKVFDVTIPSSPSMLTIDRNGADGTVSVKNSGTVPQVVVFDTQLPQYKISGFRAVYSPVATQNLHALKNEGADFIIITTPQWREYADQIADLHRQYDGIKVAVATTEECYNEFSGGVPDPMAYRSFAKMLYMSPIKPKNMLLIGQLYSDFRGLHVERDQFDGIIAYQSREISVQRGAHNINDFYGMMDDNLRNDYFERNSVQIGVAIMPLHFASEGEIVVKKIKDYLERTDHAFFLNKYTGIGGNLDNHTHDDQVAKIDSYVRSLSNLGTIFTPLSIDTYGYDEARKKMINQFNEGMTWLTYFGHGAEQFLGKNRFFFTAGDVFKLRNTYLPFAGFGGCQITNSDRGVRGLGESIVTSTPYGCIGSLVSARETWSGQNLEFFKQFFVCLFNQGSTTTSQRRDEPATIGEVYASVKNYSYYSNELAYQLICDPALIVPCINGSVQLVVSADNPVKAIPGETMELTGYITRSNGTKDTSFNGQMVLRLNEPTDTIPCQSLIDKADPGNLKFYARDAQLSMGVGEVKNGDFTISIHIPATTATFRGKNANVFLSAYDPSTRKGAGRGYVITIEDAPAQGSTETRDKIPPIIEEFRFDPEECRIELTVSDNVALNLSTSPLSKGLYLYIDGKERSEAHFELPILENGRTAYRKSVALEGISYGEHSAGLKVKDAAGNTTIKEITFTYNPLLEAYSILLSEESDADRSVIVAEEKIPQMARLIIISPSGTQVWSGEFENGKAIWNHIDAAGQKVAPGHYKGYIMETGNSDYNGHSPAIDIPVI